MKYTISLIIALSTVWSLWSGHFDPLMLILGLVSILLTTLLVVRMRVVDVEGAPLEPLSRMLGYLPWLMKEIVLSNIDVAWRILHPKLPIQPSLFFVRSTQKTDLGRVIFANSITLTPGTFAIHLQRDRVEVHALSNRSAASLKEGTMDQKVSRVEGGP